MSNPLHRNLIYLGYPNMAIENDRKLFEINGKELKSLRIWEKKHASKCRLPPDRTPGIGGGLTYSFTPTGIGVAITVRCSVCNIEHDMTDYESW